MSEKLYCVYLLACSDGTSYCGITCDLKRRLRQHNEGKASKYTRTRLPVYVQASTTHEYTKSEALRLELKIKSLRPHQKFGAVLEAEGVVSGFGLTPPEQRTRAGMKRGANERV